MTYRVEGVGPSKKPKQSGYPLANHLVKETSPSQQTTVRNSLHKIPTSTIELTGGARNNNVQPHFNPKLVPQNMILHHSLDSYYDHQNRAAGSAAISPGHNRVIPPMLPETHLIDPAREEGGNLNHFQILSQIDGTMEAQGSRRVVQVAKIEMIRKTTVGQLNSAKLNGLESVPPQSDQTLKKKTDKSNEPEYLQDNIKRDYNTESSNDVVLEATGRNKKQPSIARILDPIITSRQSLSNYNSVNISKHQFSSPRNNPLGGLQPRDTTSYESERSSMFNEKLHTGALHSGDHQKRRKSSSLEKTIVKAISGGGNNQGIRGVAFLAGKRANLNLMEQLNNGGFEGKATPPQIQSIKIHQFLELNLRMQNLSTLQEGLFGKNQFLRSVDLRNNMIKELPNAICDLSILWKLRVDCNLLEHLPPYLGKLERLEALTASNNKLKNVPLSLYQLSEKLTTLQLNDNLIKRLPSQLGNLRKLKTLLLHNNRLRQLPPEICNMKELCEFSLEWFSYIIPPTGKILKDSRGQLLIKDFQSFASVMHEIHSEGASTNQLHFIHFIGHFNKLKTLEDFTEQSQFPKRRTIFHYLCLNGHLHLLKDLLSSLPPDPNVLNAPDSDGTTPLTLAFKNKQSSMITFLLKTILMGETSLKQTLPLWLRQQKLNLKGVSQKYGLALNITIKNHDYRVARLILRGAVNNSQNTDKKYIGDLPIMLDINAKDHDFNNAMHVLMAHFGHDSKESAHIAMMLIRNGIDINALNKHELSPLHIAIKSFQQKALKFALDYNLYHLSKKNSKPLFDLELKCGNSQWNPLHYAVYNNNMSAVMLLLKYAQMLPSLDQSTEFLWARDGDGRRAQDLCPYNSPMSKMISQTQARLILLQRHQVPSIVEQQHSETYPYQQLKGAIRSTTEVVEHFNIRRKLKRLKYKTHKQMMSLEKTLKRSKSNGVLHNEHNMMSGERSTALNYHLGAKQIHQRNNKSNEKYISSLTTAAEERLSQPIHRNQSVLVRISRQGGSQELVANSVAKQQSPRLFQKVPPLPPKRLMQIKNHCEQDHQQIDVLQDMEELLQSKEFYRYEIAPTKEEKEELAMFMSHQLNFDTQQDVHRQELNDQSYEGNDQISPDLDISSDSSHNSCDSDQEGQFEDILDRPVTDLDGKALNNIGSYYKSQRPKSYTDVQLSNSQQYQSAGHSQSFHSQQSNNSSSCQNTPFNPTTLNQLLMTPKEDVVITTNIGQALNDATDHQTFKRNRSESDDEDGVCDAADEEPEAGSLGKMIANKINKFENNPKELDPSRTKVDREALVRLIDDINQVKRIYKVQALAAKVKTPNQYGPQESLFKSRDLKQRVPGLVSARRYGEDEEEEEWEEGNVFDTLNQGPFLANQIPGSLQYQRIQDSQFSSQTSSFHSTPQNLIILQTALPQASQMPNDQMSFSSAILNRQRRGTLSTRNQDCVIDPVKDKIIKSVKNLRSILGTLSLPQGFTALYQILALPPIIQPSSLQARDQALLSLFKYLLNNPDFHLLTIHFLALIVHFHSKAFIPILEKLVLKVKKIWLQRGREKSTTFKCHQLTCLNEFWFAYELHNILAILTNEIMVQSRVQMEKENTEIKKERERSRQRLQRAHTTKAGSIDKAADISDDESGAKSITAGQQSSNYSIIIQNATGSIREVPEFVARLQKSPSSNSVSRGSNFKNNFSSQSRMHDFSYIQSILPEKSMSVLEQHVPNSLGHVLQNSGSQKRLTEGAQGGSHVQLHILHSQTPKNYGIVSALQLQFQKKKPAINHDEKIEQKIPPSSSRTKGHPTALSVFKNRPYKFQQSKSPSDGLGVLGSSTQRHGNNPFVKRSRSPQDGKKPLTPASSTFQMMLDQQSSRFIKLASCFPLSSRTPQLESQQKVPNQIKQQPATGLVQVSNEIQAAAAAFYKKPTIPQQQNVSTLIPNQPPVHRPKQNPQYSLPYGHGVRVSGIPIEQQLSPHRYSKHNVHIQPEVFKQQAIKQLTRLGSQQSMLRGASAPFVAEIILLNSTRK